MHKPTTIRVPRPIALVRRLRSSTELGRTSLHRYDQVLLVIYLLTIILAAVPMVRAAFTPLIRGDEDPLGTVFDVSTWQVEGTGETVTIPHAFADVAPGQTIRLTTTVGPSSDREDRCLYVGMSHAYMRVLADGTPLTDYGSPDTLPAYLHGSAPPASFVLRLPTARQPIELTVELTAPRQGAMHIEDVFTGSLQGMRVALLARMGGILCAAMGLLAFGILEFIRSFIAEDRGIRWQGMLTFSLGCWALGDCDLTCVLAQRPLFLYWLSCVGLYGIPIAPLEMLHLGMNVRTPLTEGCRIGARIFLLLAIMGQTTGAWTFEQSTIAFYCVGGALVTIAIVASLVSIRRRSRQATSQQRASAASLVVLTASLFLELVNYQTVRVVPELSIAMVGTLAYIFATTYQSGITHRNALSSERQNALISARLATMLQTARSERERYHELAALSNEIRRQRHDLKHVLATIDTYERAGDREAVRRFVEEQIAAIPQVSVAPTSNNQEADAICRYYLSRALQMGCACTATIELPEELDDGVTNSVCMVLGNLLENAIAACREAQELGGIERPQLLLQGRLVGTTLFVVQRNSFHHTRRGMDGRYLSTKGHRGIGLSSITLLCDRLDGNATFGEEDGQFVSRVSLSLS